jgi:hypothetical protein
MTSFQKSLRWFFCALGAASCWWLAANLYRSWQTPLAVENGRWVPLGVGIMLMEFVVVHSGVMLAMPMSKEAWGSGRRRRFSRRTSLILMSVTYVALATAIAASLKSLELFLMFSGIIISRWAGLLIDSDTARDQQFNRSLLSFLLFLIAVILAFVVKFPPGGLTPMILRRLGAGANAQQALAAGVIYFGLSGVVEATGPFWQRPKVRVIIQNILGLVVLIVFVLGFAWLSLGRFRGHSH